MSTHPGVRSATSRSAESGRAEDPSRAAILSAPSARAIANSRLNDILRLRPLDDDELIHHVLQDIQPDLQQVQLIEDDKAVVKHGAPRNHTRKKVFSEKINLDGKTLRKNLTPQATGKRIKLRSNISRLINIFLLAEYCKLFS